MYRYKLIIHDDNFNWCMVCESDQSGPINMIEAEFARNGIQIHEYHESELYLSIYGKRYQYYEKED